MKHRRDSRAAPAMTLLEMVVSMAIISLMLGAVSSAVVIASRTAQQNIPSAFNDSAPAEALRLLLNEVSLATAITESTPTAITFVIPDRTGDLNDETIRYSWSGIAGDPLLRQVNSAMASPVSGTLRSFALSYDSEANNPSVPHVDESQPDALLYSFDEPVTDSIVIDSTTAASQYIRPDFADGTLNWTITSIDLFVKQSGTGSPSGQLQIQLVTANAQGTPDTEVHSVVPFDERDLSKAYDWISFVFTDAPILVPGDSICIVVSDTAGETSADIALALQSSSRSNVAQGDVDTSTWSVIVGKSMPYRIRGTIVTSEPVALPLQTFCKRISVELADESGQATRGSTSVFNQPELP